MPDGVNVASNDWLFRAEAALRLSVHQMARTLSLMFPTAAYVAPNDNTNAEQAGRHVTFFANETATV